MNATTERWTWENDEEHDGDNWLIVDLGSDNYDVVAIVPKTDDEDHKNAVLFPRVRLLAAAPALLAACQRVLRSLDWAVPADCMSSEEMSKALSDAIEAAGVSE